MFLKKTKAKGRNEKEDGHEKERMMKELWQISEKYLGRNCACLNKINNVSAVSSCDTERKVKRIEMD